MNNLLFDVHQLPDCSWRWHGSSSTDHDFLIVSRREWPSRAEAVNSMRRFIEVVGIVRRR